MMCSSSPRSVRWHGRDGETWGDDHRVRLVPDGLSQILFCAVVFDACTETIREGVKIGAYLCKNVY